MEARQQSADSLLSYVRMHSQSVLLKEQKDDQFLSKLKGDLNALATDTITKEVLLSFLLNTGCPNKV